MYPDFKNSFINSRLKIVILLPKILVVVEFAKETWRIAIFSKLFNNRILTNFGKWT